MRLVPPRSPVQDVPHLPLDLDESLQLEGNGIDGSDLKRMEHNICAEVRRLLVEHHEQVTSCVESLRGHISGKQQALKIPVDKSTQHEEKDCHAQANDYTSEGTSVNLTQLASKFSSHGSKKKAALPRQQTRDTEEEDLACARSMSASASAISLSKVGSDQTRFQRLVLGAEFQLFSAIAICSNALVIGWEIESTSRHPSEKQHDHFKYVAHVYAGIFFAELVLKFCAERSQFFNRHNRRWNFLDIVLVFSAVVESATQILYPAESSGLAVVGNFSSMRIIRVVRVVRVLRLMRIARIVRYVAALSTLLYSIANTIKDLFWTVLLLTMIIYISAIVFTQAFIDNYMNDPSGDFQFWWGSLFKAMLTLYKIISGGVSWHEPAVPLENIGALWIWMLMVYVFFTYFAVLNVITGIFCNNAIETAAQNPDLIASSIIHKKHDLSERLRTLFTFIDDDGTGEITLQELELLLANEEMQAYFEAIDLDPRDAWTLFKLIDSDKTHKIEVEEFIAGVLKLKGEARAIDVALLIKDQNRLLRKVTEVMEHVKANHPHA